MSMYDKTDRWDDENAGRPLPPMRQQLEARIAELEAERRELLANLNVERSRSAVLEQVEADAAKLKARIAELEAAITAYLSEVDNPAADYNYRKVLRDRLRDLVRARPAP